MSFVIQEDPSLPTVDEAAISPATMQPVDEKDASGNSVPTEQKQDVKEEVRQEEGEKEEEEKKSRLQCFLHSIFAYYVTNQFPIHIMLAILLARAYPPLGAEYLQPDITATWIAVCIIFFLSGMGIRTEEFSKAFQRYYFNGFVQLFNFGIVSIVVFAVSRLLTVAHMLDANLADGMIICACLPMAINVVIVLSALTGADEAAAVFNSAFGNIVGIFLSPVLILAYLGKTGSMSLEQVFARLTIKVVVPLVIGQILHNTSKKACEVFATHKRMVKKIQEICLIFIVYTVFCKTFEGNTDVGIGNVFLMILYQFLLMVFLMITAWYSLKFLFHDEPELRVMGVFGCVQKTVALGVPLIASVYKGDPNVGIYTLPILIWHPMQLVLGSMLVPRLKAFILSERKRLDAVTIENETTVETVHTVDTVVGEVEAQEKGEEELSEAS